MNEKQSLPAESPSFARRILPEIGSYAKYMLSAVAVALLINNFVLANAHVLTGSMENTVMTGSRVFCNRLAYLKSDPKRFDIILFNFTESSKTTRYFKRIIGLPGEKVEIREGNVYINDSDTPLRDDFVNDTPHGNYGPFQVPEDSYFLLGDNRNDSYDSKAWPDPFIHKKEILGKALLVYYPEIKVLKNTGD